ncbi:SbcC/MukB-like Walker B domain-containing protein, partial [Paenibacillus xylaniclasticus]|uniref:SbcC/MukB-like Walker B domain-containing protein n=1 Tax=Paenibacillus xylaniclasticus TaxID=588083 RepID=UPI0024829104
LAALEPLVRTLAERRAEVDRLIAEERGLAAKLQEMERTLAQLRGEKHAAAERIAADDAKTAKLPELLEQLAKLRDRHRILGELAEAERKLGELARAEAELTASVKRMRSEHDRLEEAWLEGQASLLAVHLHDGKPCPVCGSTEHPEKAVPAGELPSREALQAKKEQLQAIERELSAALAQAAAERERLDGHNHQLDEYGIRKDLPLHVQQASTLEDGKRLKQETDHLKVVRDGLAQLRDKAVFIDRRLESVQREKDLLSEQLRELTVNRSAKQSRLETELEAIDEPLRTPERLAARLREYSDRAAVLTAAWKQAEDALQSASTRLAELRAAAVQLAESSAEADKEHAEASDRFADELEKDGFASKDEYLSARLTESARALLREQVDSYRAAAAAAADAVLQLERELEGQSPADTSAIEASLSLIRVELEEALLALQTADRYAQASDRLRASIAQAAEQCASLEGQLEQVADLYQMVKGDNPLKMSFERYILIEYLDQILHAANERLRSLSDGQFVLLRSDRLEARGKQSGLGLDVYDAYTGQNRDVKSLSGGEKFNASLALALGMTDVIQSYQGGISIEMMFIDEGFGSLDEESLSKAILTLVDLQKAGRMIGVISHVEELKQAFPAAIEVSKTKEGHSRASIVLK